MIVADFVSTAVFKGQSHSTSEKNIRVKKSVSMWEDLLDDTISKRRQMDVGSKRKYHLNCQFGPSDALE